MATQQGSTKAGRLGSTGTFQNTVAPKSAEQAMLIQLDSLVTAIQALTAKLDADAGVTDTNYTALIGATLSLIKLVR